MGQSVRTKTSTIGFPEASRKGSAGVPSRCRAVFCAGSGKANDKRQPAAIGSKKEKQDQLGINLETFISVPGPVAPKILLSAKSLVYFSKPFPKSSPNQNKNGEPVKAPRRGGGVSLPCFSFIRRQLSDRTAVCALSLPRSGP